VPGPVLSELEQVERAIVDGGVHLRHEVVCRVRHRDQELPVYAITLGNADAGLPAVGYFGGVHGVERIGARVPIAFLQHLVARLAWDVVLHDLLQRVQILFMPVVNPGGMARGTRSNPCGVDLMRNAPLDAQDPPPFLLGGHRIGRRLPWYRGPAGAPMQAESAALCAWVRRELHGRPLVLTLDCHSGFGVRDRIWFPFAHRRAPMEALPEMHALHGVFAGSYLNHPYVVEPQSRQYLTHGDLWDHLVLQAADEPGVFLPLTLEMGSWLWVKKNPRQFFSRGGIFNPLIDHRERRVLRRHLPLLDFLLHAAASHAQWLPAPDEREAHRRAALARWYGAAGT
jgi:hypothetical protein